MDYDGIADFPDWPLNILSMVELGFVEL
ncbi:PE-PPE domain-containing protein [Sinomonas notoginsengisoli]